MDVQPLLPGMDALVCEQVSVESAQVIVCVRGAGASACCYDDPSCGVVFVCRQTRSQRLYQQIVGRVLRPHKSIARQLGDLATADERRALIAASPKPEALVCNMVGIEPEVRDMTIVDILGERLGEEVKARTKQNMLNPPDEEDEEQDADEQAARAAKQVAEEQRIKEEAERRERNRVRVDADVQIEYGDALGRQKVDGRMASHLPSGVHRVLRDVAGVPDHVLSRLSVAEAAAGGEHDEADRQRLPQVCPGASAALHRLDESRRQPRPSGISAR